MTNPLPTDTLSKLEYELLADFRYQLRRFLRFSEELTQSHGVTPLQYLLMLQIKGYPGRDWGTIAELAERLQSHHHGVVALASRCEKAGLIARRPGRDDGRCVEIYLLPKGEELLRELALLHRDQLCDLQHMLKIPAENMLQRFSLAPEPASAALD